MRLNKLKTVKKNGFTLIEFLIVFAISSVMLSISVNSFNTYNNTQIHNTSVTGVVSMLNSARAKSISQVKPEVCGSNVLDGYEVRITIPGPNYVQNVVCGGSRHVMQQGKLNSRVSFSNTSATNIFFDVATGIVTSPGAIGLTGPSKASTISVDKIGIITISDGAQAGGVTPTQNPGITPGITPTGLTTVALSLSPNPSSLYQSVTFTATVTGNGCIPAGYVLFFADNAAGPFAGAALSGDNPKIATSYYPALNVGTRSIQAKYFTSSSCPNADSSYVNQNIQ
jgi:prepilin-type N-terminal cleavage/methylation domain-containing protein